MMTGAALLVGGAVHEGSLEIVRRMAAGFDLVVGVDGGAATCLAAGFMPHVAVGDFDSIDTESLRLVRESGSLVMPYSADKDVSDLDLALRYVREQGVTRLTATGVLGDRIDHTIASTGSLCRSGIRTLDVVEPGLAGWIVGADGPDELEIEGVGATVSVMACIGEVVVSLSGTKWALDHATLPPASSHGLSNLIVDGCAVVSVHHGVALVLSPEVSGTKPAARKSRNTP